MSNVDILCGPSQFLTPEDDIDLLVDQDFLAQEMAGIDEHVDLRYCLMQMRNHKDEKKLLNSLQQASQLTTI